MSDEINQDYQANILMINIKREQIANAKAQIVKWQGEVTELLAKNSVLKSQLKAPKNAVGRPRKAFEDLSPSTQALYKRLERQANPPAPPHELVQRLNNVYDSQMAKIHAGMLVWSQANPNATREESWVKFEDLDRSFFMLNMFKTLVAIREPSVHPTNKATLIQYMDKMVATYAQLKAWFGKPPYGPNHTNYLGNVVNGDAIVAEYEHIKDGSWTHPEVYHQGMDPINWAKTEERNTAIQQSAPTLTDAEDEAIKEQQGFKPYDPEDPETW